MYQDIKSYITHFPILQVVVCRFCKICISSKDPLRHYKDNHTAKKDHHVSMEIRRKIADYMATLDLREPDKVICPRGPVPQLKVIKNGWVCNFAGCGQCSTSESGMLTHYYTHQKHIPKGFKDWESTSIQTFFEGHHRKYGKSFCILIVDILPLDESHLKMIKLVLMCWFNNSWTMLKREKL